MSFADMSMDELKEKAKERVKADNLDASNFKVSRVYEHVMDGTLISVSFTDKIGKEDFNHLHFSKNEIRFYRWHNDVLTAVANYKERNTFFRFLEYAGVGGLLACLLVLIFSLLLCSLALLGKEVNTSVVEIIKMSFTIILGFFFGSQVATKK